MKIKNYSDLYKEFFVTDFKLRYKHSVLGFFWVIFKPLALFSILYVVWSSIFKTSENFALYLLLGVITLNFFNEGINFGLQSLFNKGHIILKINFPREIVVYSSISIAIVNFFINLLIFLVFSMFSSLNTSIEGVIMVVISIFSLFLLILGISFFLSIMSIKLHDIRHLVELILQMAFWATPVLYDINVLPSKFKSLVLLNPLTYILNNLRTGLLDAGQINPNLWFQVIIIFIGCLILTLLGYIFFNSRIKKIAQYF